MCPGMLSRNWSGCPVRLSGNETIRCPLNNLESVRAWGKIPTMNVYTVDNKRRVRIPGAKPGQAISIEGSPNSGWNLKLVETKEPKMANARLVKENGYTVTESDRPFDEAAVKAALEDFPP